jgi:large subunit ribosomal protein L24
MVARIKKNDTVVVLSGKDKNKQGTVIEILPKKGKVMVKGVALITKHYKARKQGEVSGIKKQEAYVGLSQVMPVCSACKKACRVVTQSLDNGSRVRACNRCKNIL